MIINDSLKLNEVKSINLGNGSTAYKSGGKYYIKKGDSKKEISSDQYNKLKSKNVSNKSNKSSNFNDEPDYEEIKRTVEDDFSQMTHDEVQEIADFWVNASDEEKREELKYYDFDAEHGLDEDKMIEIFDDYFDQYDPGYDTMHHMSKQNGERSFTDDQLEKVIDNAGSGHEGFRYSIDDSDERFAIDLVDSGDYETDDNGYFTNEDDKEEIRQKYIDSIDDSWYDHYDIPRKYRDDMTEYLADQFIENNFVS